MFRDLSIAGLLRKARSLLDGAGFHPKWASPGVVATALMALAGIVIGAGAAGFAGYGTLARADIMHAEALDLRDAPLANLTLMSPARSAIVERILSAGAPTRFQADLLAPPSLGRPKPRIIIIFDDMGLDVEAYRQVLSLPGPVTLSFLPYASGLQNMADRTRARGHEVMLHLPMEPSGPADPGPHSLQSDMSNAELRAEVEWNLSQFSGYVGVNNHMGSKLSRDENAMEVVLSALKDDELFFLDSLTTGQSRISQAGKRVGAKVITRDVFLDPDADRHTVFRQLALTEQIARETGYAVAICHPRSDTIDIIGPWLTSAPSRGFELATLSSLMKGNRAQESLQASAPALRR